MVSYSANRESEEMTMSLCCLRTEVRFNLKLRYGYSFILEQVVSSSIPVDSASSSGSIS